MHNVHQPILKADALQNAIFSSANFSCIATDARGVIQIFNVGAEHMLGYKAADVVDKITPAEISDAQELIARATSLSLELDTPITPGFEAMVFKATRGIEDIYELTYIRKDGSRFPAIVSVTALRDSQEKIIGYLLIGTDNAARKEVEAKQAQLDQRLREHQVELQETNRSLEIAKAAAEKANLAKSEFLSNMSHELRTPLNAVLGFAQLMESETPSPTPAQKLSIEQILKGGWYLLHLINEILDLASIESGKVAMLNELVSISDVLQDCQTLMEPQMHKRGVQMTIPRVKNLFYVHGDPNRVKQVVVNLLSNAIKYNSDSGKVIVESRMVEGHRVRVSVTDTGAGLTSEQLSQLFQPFNRLGKETGVEEGTGIGLVVTKQLVELMGGSVGVESKVGVGSVFWFELPASNAAQGVFDIGSEIDPATQEWEAEPECTSPRTILYVEDNLANLALVEQLITRRSDLKMLTATNGKLGVELARTHLPDVILMDINLPGISGIKALELLREDPATAHIPVMALSANAESREIEKGLSAGFFRYLTKPIKFDEFMAALDLALHHAAKNARTSSICS